MPTPHTQGAHRCTSIRRSFSPDGSRVVTASNDRTAKVWDAMSGVLDPTLKGHSEMVAFASFSPDGLRVVTGSYDKTAKVWDVKSGTDVLTLKGHTDNVTETRFSPDGSRVISGSYDKTSKIWDAAPVSQGSQQAALPMISIEVFAGMRIDVGHRFKPR